MNTKRLVTGALVGGIVLWGVGYLIWRVAFASFFAANAGSAIGVARDPSLMWAIVLGNLALALLLTLAVTWARASSIAEGFKIGAIVGFLVWFGVDFIHYGISNVSNLTATIIDPLLEIVHNGIAGAAIVAVLTKNTQSRGQVA